MFNSYGYCFQIDFKNWCVKLLKAYSKLYPVERLNLKSKYIIDLPMV